MADVYLGVARGLVGFTKLSVVKVVKREIASEPEHIKLFLDEARISARLNHPNVVQTNEVGEEQGTYYLVMEYLEGQTLRRAMRIEAGADGRAALPIFLRTISDVLAGLHYAHELCDYDGRPLGVVHRDVSPHNIFVTYEGSVKLVDFGIAKAAGALHLTGAGVLRGKFAYMAPEQARGETVDRRADIYAAGVVLWEMLARRRMWPHEHELTILRRITSGALPSLRQHAPGAPRALVAACERALQLDPDKRFETAQDMRAAIEEVLGTWGWHATSADVGAMVSERFRDERAEFRRRVEEAFTTDAGVPTLAPFPLSVPSLRAVAAWGSSASKLHPLPAAGKPATPITPPPPADTTDAHAAIPPSSQPASSPPPVSARHSVRIASARPAVPASPGTPYGLTRLPTGDSTPPRRPLAATVLAGFIGALLTVVIFAGSNGYFWRNEAPAAPPPPSAVTSAPIAAPSPRPPAPSATLKAAPLSSTPVELHVKVSPPHATIYLDDRRLQGNPFRGTFPRGGEHELRVEAKGYETATQRLRFEQDINEASISLSRMFRHPPRVKRGGGGESAPPDGDDQQGKRSPRPIDSALPY